jgi:hypothetical protein
MINSEKKNAIISNCEKYRYLLSRGDCSNPLVFIMLNPSTADAYLDDPTIRRCLGFANTGGYDGIIVINLYAFRSSNPKDLLQTQDPVGSENDKYISNTLMQYKNIVCAWGSNALLERVSNVMCILKQYNANVLCLGLNKNGSPKHPLYIKANQELLEYI